MRSLFTHVRDVPGYLAPDASEKVIKFLVDPEDTPLRKVKAGMTILPAGHTNGPVDHLREEFFFILEGTGEFTVDDETQPIEPWSLVVIPPNARHSVTAGPETLTYIWVSSDPPAVTEQKREWQLAT